MRDFSEREKRIITMYLTKGSTLRDIFSQFDYKILIIKSPELVRETKIEYWRNILGDIGSDVFDFDKAKVTTDLIEIIGLLMYLDKNELIVKIPFPSTAIEPLLSLELGGSKHGGQSAFIFYNKEVINYIFNNYYLQFKNLEPLNIYSRNKYKTSEELRYKSSLMLTIGTAFLGILTAISTTLYQVFNARNDSNKILIEFGETRKEFEQLKQDRTYKYNTSTIKHLTKRLDSLERNILKLSSSKIKKKY